MEDPASAIWLRRATPDKEGYGATNAEASCCWRRLAAEGGESRAVEQVSRR